MNVRMELKAHFVARSVDEEARRIAHALDGGQRSDLWEVASLAGGELGLARLWRVSPGWVLHVVGDTDLAEQLRERYRSGAVAGWSLHPIEPTRTPLEEVRDRMAAGEAGPNLWCEKLLCQGFAYAEEVTACPDEALLDLVGVGQRVLADLRAALPFALPSPRTQQKVVTGNAGADAGTRDWLVGHFAPPDSGRRADEVEVKWAQHAAGETREDWSPPADSRTLTILVAGGAFRVDVGEESLVLREPGTTSCSGQDTRTGGTRWTRPPCSPSAGRRTRHDHDGAAAVHSLEELVSRPNTAAASGRVVRSAVPWTLAR